MANEADKVLNDFLSRLQKKSYIRKGLAISALMLMCGILGYVVFDIVPRQYHFKITGGDILTNRHYLAKVIQQEIEPKGVSLEILPTSGSKQAFDEVVNRKLSFAFIQGGLDLQSPDVVHVATIAPELLHFLVSKEVNSISDLKGKRINMGSKNGGTRIVAKDVLRFSNLIEGADYVESNITNEDLLTFHADRMPDAIVMSSFAPAPMADYLIKKHGYRLLEIPFPSSLALRLGWVADSQILAYTYNVHPAVPERDIKTVGVNLYLIAHKDVGSRAVFKVLETLYGPDIQRQLRIKLYEENILTSAVYPIAEGTLLFLDRHNPFFSNENLDQVKAIFAVLLSLGSTLLVIIKWFRGDSIEPVEALTDDTCYLEFISQVLTIDADISEAQQNGEIPLPLRQDMLHNLTTIKSKALQKLANAQLSNTHLPQYLLLAIRDTRARIENA